MSKIDPRLIDWEDEDFDLEEEQFQKLTHKARIVKRHEEEAIRRQRLEKQRNRESCV